MSHPNTTAVGLSGGASTLLVYLLNRYAGTSLNPVDASGIATALAAAVLFVGRRGIRGALLTLWRGQEQGGTGAAAFIGGAGIPAVAAAVVKQEQRRARRTPSQKRVPKP